MSTMTTFSPAHGALAPAKAAPQRKGVFQRFLARMIEARMAKAEEIVRQQRHLLPREFEQAGWKITERSESSLPFMR
jgi:hypothetical protein